MFDQNLYYTSQTIDGAWEHWYNVLTKDVSKQESRDGAVVGEIINAVTVIEDPTRCILKSPIRNLPMRYMVGELLWYLSGNIALDAIRLYTSAWDRMSDDGVTVNSNYGARIQKAYCEASGEIFNQFSMVEELLRQHPESRQAVIHIKQARNLMTHPSKDVNCTVCLQFFIRDGKLSCTTYMRSNDLWMGFPNDVFQFTCIQILLAMKLGVKVGRYTHIAGSLHLYERDFKTSLENIKKQANAVVDGVEALKKKEE